MDDFTSKDKETAQKHAWHAIQIFRPVPGL